VWCGVVWCGVVWCGVVWCGVVWCGVVWCGVVAWWCVGGAVAWWCGGWWAVGMPVHGSAGAAACAAARTARPGRPPGHARRHRLLNAPCLPPSPARRPPAVLQPADAAHHYLWLAARALERRQLGQLHRGRRLGLRRQQRAVAEHAVAADALLQQLQPVRIHAVLVLRWRWAVAGCGGVAGAARQRRQRAAVQQQRQALGVGQQPSARAAAGRRARQRAAGAPGAAPARCPAGCWAAPRRRTSCGWGRS
jgi:hypothetical protein